MFRYKSTHTSVISGKNIWEQSFSSKPNIAERKWRGKDCKRKKRKVLQVHVHTHGCYHGNGLKVLTIFLIFGSRQFNCRQGSQHTSFTPKPVSTDSELPVLGNVDTVSYAMKQSVSEPSRVRTHGPAEYQLYDQTSASNSQITKYVELDILEFEIYWYVCFCSVPF